MWPGALLISPMYGLVTTALGGAVVYARPYAVWSRLAGISTIVMCIIYAQYSQYIPLYVAVIVAYMTLSRLFQCALIDIYIAHMEAIRYTRGWDGLSSCLYNAKDQHRGLTYEEEG